MPLPERRVRAPERRCQPRLIVGCRRRGAFAGIDIDQQSDRHSRYACQILLDDPAALQDPQPALVAAGQPVLAFDGTGLASRAQLARERSAIVGMNDL